ncbi:MAG: topoisomerase DNA-binding C4 zinc finger domain-containing protein [Oscillospiraceae bacterium]|nr:topoisomerase DNA-binding C4 zinc finger domain-containing protein [Oscillospiraceae bacterium]
MAIKQNERGKFWACTGFPNCRNIKSYEIKTVLNSSDSVQKPEVKTPFCTKCGKSMVLRNGQNGQFWGCSGYPQCRNTKNI